MIHAHHKEFTDGKNGKTYAKGHAAKYHAYIAREHPNATHMSSRGQKGSRHDHVFLAGLVVYINRPGAVEYMDDEFEGTSLLVDANYINLTSEHMTALSRAFGIFFLVVIEPYRFFSGTDSFALSWMMMFPTSSRMMRRRRRTMVKTTIPSIARLSDGAR